MAARGPVWLVGMMGAGKSTVGPALAQRLGRRFVDSDAEIERECRAPVAEIFARDGEAAFRARERALVARLCAEPVVAALGGGAVAQPGVAETAARAGTLVWLRARPETLLARLGDAAARPLLAGLAGPARLARLRELCAAREAAYARAELVVDTDGLACDEIVELVAEALAARGVAA